VFQHYALFPHLTVFRNIAFGLEQKNTPPAEIRRRVDAILEMVELPGKEDRYPHQLSGGEKQRVALGRALVLEPPVLLLDEPLGALDQKLRQQMQVELKRLRVRLGITFIFVTHDQQEALIMSDRIAVINHGRLEQVGTGEEIYERPRTHFVAEFMGVENFFKAKCAAHTPEGTRFVLASGEALWASNDPGLAVDSTVTLAVRPECVRLAHVAPPGNERRISMLEGEIVESIYEGGSRRLAIRLKSGERVIVRESQTHDAAQAADSAAGSKIYISWDAAKTLVYPEAMEAS
jgi:ABC-type Fe3+/spermidine/putrescine transport system ATPase subunit